jgi:sphinganine-1-phosphate aldolase
LKSIRRIFQSTTAMKTNHKRKFPQKGLNPEEVVRHVYQMKVNDISWKSGRMFGYVFFPGEEYAEILGKIYSEFLYENTLNPMAFLSLRKMENETVSMVADLLHGDENVVGNMTTGGTESIMLAMKAARDRAINLNPDIKPEVIVPVSAHPAFEKAAHYLSIRLIKAPLREDKRVDVQCIPDLITENTIMLVGSAPCFPHGVIDPIEELAVLARSNHLLFHVDACMGGFMLPFVKDLGYPVPEFDFKVPGVTSISADNHKYGYANKGASVILYRNPEIRRHQFFVTTDWPGGIFASATFMGTKCGGAIATAWAMIKILGFEGYRDIAAKVMETTRKIREGVNSIKGLKILGDPAMSLVAITSDYLDVFDIGDEMGKKGWLLDRLQFPNSLHMTISKIHIGCDAEFLKDLNYAVRNVRKSSFSGFSNRIMVAATSKLSGIIPEKTFQRIAAFSMKFFTKDNAKKKGSAALYGISARLENRENVREMMLEMMDRMFKPA